MVKLARSLNNVRCCSRGGDHILSARHRVRYATQSTLIAPRAPGSGKSTYCYGLQQWMDCIKRPACIVNMDPANDVTQYSAGIDIKQLITVEDVMQEKKLGPNGALLYCMEFLECNLEWLFEQILEKYKNEGIRYFVFDLPGQIELYTHHQSMVTILNTMMMTWGWRCCVVNMVDSHHCSDVSKYISLLLVCLSTMIHLNAPTVNVLTKVDIAENFGKLGLLACELY